jgi:hypothetical protein
MSGVLIFLVKRKRIRRKLIELRDAHPQKGGKKIRILFFFLNHNLFLLWREHFFGISQGFFFCRCGNNTGARCPGNAS